MLRPSNTASNGGVFLCIDPGGRGFLRIITLHVAANAGGPCGG